MVHDHRTGPIVVGVDASAPSASAVDWAVLTASNADVVAVHVREADHDLESIGLPAGATLEIADGPRADALLAAVEAHSARLLVIGRHRRRTALPQRIGRLAVELVRRTSVPLAIVGTTTSPSDSGTIVVGVGAGHATDAALAWAAVWAAEHDAQLELVRAVPHRPRLRSDGMLEVIGGYVDPQLARRWAAEDVDAAARAVSDRNGVSIAHSISSGSTADVLSAAALDASLIVVGLHESEWVDSKRRLRGALLRDLLAVECPLVIVPTADSHAIGVDC